MKPVIIIAGEDSVCENSHSPHLIVSHKYADAVMTAGGLPLLAMDYRSIDEYAELADGLMLTAGPTIHPGRYQQFINDFSEMQGFVQARDDMDFALCKAFLAKGKPVMGIARGAKVLQIVLNSCFQDKRDQLPYVGCALTAKLFDEDRQPFDTFLSMCAKGAE